MMEYCITMERTLRVAVHFEASSDDAACEKANEIYDNATPTDFEAGDVGHDYALCDTSGRTLVDWE